MIRIMMVDDEPHVVSALSRTLRRDWGDTARLETFTDPHLALARAEEASFDVVISDYRMPYMDGVSLLSAIRDLQPSTSRLILSASTDFNVLMSAINDAGVARFIAKPWQDEEIARIVRQAVDATFDAREQQRLADERRIEVSKGDVAQVERRKLESLEPGITKVRWGPNGEVLLDDE